jgi:hypothetical protein
MDRMDVLPPALNLAVTHRGEALSDLVARGPLLLIFLRHFG